MKPSEMFELILSKVAEVCEVDRKDILEVRKNQSVVQARMMVVHYLRSIGLSNEEIAKYVLEATGAKVDTQSIRRKAKGVYKMYRAFPDRRVQTYDFGLKSEEIRQFCRETYSTLYREGMRSLPCR